MQKLITFPLLALYVFVSIGIHGVSHYCGDDFIGIALFEVEEAVACNDNSCCTIPENEPECCTELEFSLLYESERSLALMSNRIFLKIAALPVLPYSTLEISDDPDISEEFFHTKGPQDTSSPPLYLKHQSLIFYG